MGATGAAASTALTVVVASAGCEYKLPPTPALYALGGVDPFDGLIAEEMGPTIDLFVATTRARNEDATDGSERLYTNEREPLNRLRLARATLRLGRSDETWTDLENESTARHRAGGSPIVRVERIEEYGVLWTSPQRADTRFVRNRTLVHQHNLEDPDPDYLAQSQAFFADLRSALDGTTRREIVIFVHGYSTSFARGLKQTTIWRHYLREDAVALYFAWASKGSPFAYVKDLSSAEAAVRPLRLLLEALERETDAVRIHIIAHSAGSALLMRTLHQMRLMAHPQTGAQIGERSKLGQIVLAAPDVDLTYFASTLSDGADQMGRRMTIYTSAGDDPLAVSSSINGFERVGSLTEVPYENMLETVRNAQTVNLVNVRNAQRRYRDRLGHLYFEDNPWVSSDIFLLLLRGEGPERRGLVLEEGAALWTFPDDYEQRVRAILGVPDSSADK